MAICPFCSIEVQGNFGLSPCPKCKNPLFFDFDGQLLEQDEINIDKLDIELQSSSPQEIEMPSDLNTLPINYNEVQIEEKAIESSELNGSQALSEIQDFANQDVVTNWGQITYFIEINGIDSGELRKILLEELTDSRLGLERDFLEKKIIRGSLTLTELTPIKASVIVTRLRPFSFVVKWQQKSTTSQS